MLSNANPNAKKGCRISVTGKCKHCPHWRCMPVDVQDPTTGQILKQGTVWDCLLAWQMLGSWDSGRQTQGLHAAVNQAQNEANRRQDQVFGALVHFALPANTEKRLEHAERQDIQAG